MCIVLLANSERITISDVNISYVRFNFDGCGAMGEERGILGILFVGVY